MQERGKGYMVAAAQRCNMTERRSAVALRRSGLIKNRKGDPFVGKSWRRGLKGGKEGRIHVGAGDVD